MHRTNYGAQDKLGTIKYEQIWEYKTQERAQEKLKDAQNKIGSTGQKKDAQSK